MKKIVFILLLVVAVMSSCNQESKMHRFERETQEFTHKNCPQNISSDGMIVLDSLVFHDDGTLDMCYYYSVTADSLDKERIDEATDELRRQILAGIQNSAELRHAKEEHLNFVYIYHDRSTGEEILKLRFTPKDYE